MKSQNDHNRLKRLIANVGILLLSLGITLLAIEGIVRIFFKEPIRPRFVIDTGYGVRANQPDIITRHFFPGDYEIIITTNHAGMRGKREYTINKPPGIQRIALLGDSFIFGHGVNDKEVLSKIVEDALNDVAGTEHTGFEVLNFGVSGFGQAEELVTYRRKVQNYHPDLVVIFYFNNDIGNNAVSGLFRLDDNGRLQRTERDFLPAVKAREAMYAIAPLRLLFTHSQAWNLIRNRLSFLVHKRVLKSHGMKRHNETKPETIQLTHALLLEFLEQIRMDGALPILFIIPNKSLQSNFFLAPSEVAKAGGLLIDGRDFFTPEDYHRRDSHWNAAGHRKAAEALKLLICTTIVQ